MLRDLWPKAIEDKRVAFITGESLFADGSGQNTLRLNFSNSSVERIEKGMQALAEVFKKYL